MKQIKMIRFALMPVAKKGICNRSTTKLHLVMLSAIIYRQHFNTYKGGFHHGKQIGKASNGLASA